MTAPGCPFCGERIEAGVPACPCCRADLVRGEPAPRSLIEIRIGGNPDRKDTRRTDCYVYFHRDAEGRIFYVGQGIGDRAWSTDRHPVWQRYVDERAGGKYEIEIFRDKLTPDAATDLEQWLIEVHGPHLVNWSNPGRGFDYAALEKYHRLRNANREFVAETRPLEGSNPAEAISRYRQALATMREYEGLTLERGLVAELSTEFRCGDFDILDRLTLCLVKNGRGEEAIEEVDRYLAEFPPARERAAAKRILTRVAKWRTGIS